VTSDASLAEYYARRAREYERIYAKPERQEDLQSLKDAVLKQLAGHDVLEVACGTGYWTQIAAESAKSITALDINEGVLAIARTKEYNCPVTLRQLDAFNLPAFERTFSAGLAAFWWSHLKKEQLRSFLAQFLRALAPGALVLFIDNRYVPGSSTPISRIDQNQNTYQQRQIETGQSFEVLKNCPTEAEVCTTMADLAVEVSWIELPHYWLLTCRTLP
jgi:ubiquinone/menaquinone biosynthesis C-methylase UbiE